jgi:hypothetical protein
MAIPAAAWRQHRQVQKFAEHGEPELEVVPAIAARIARNMAPEGEESQNRAGDERHAVGAHEVGGADDDAGRPWNVISQHFEERREIRYYKHRDDGDGEPDHTDDDERITHRALDPVLDFLVLAQVFAQPQEGIVERTRRFTHPHHADEQRREDVRMPGERGGEIAARLQAVQHIVQSVAQQRIVRRLGESAQAAQQRQAGLGDRIHLSREQHQVGGRGAPGAETLQQILDRCAPCRIGRDFQGSDPEIDQSSSDPVDGVRLEAPGDEISAP